MEKNNLQIAKGPKLDLYFIGIYYGLLVIVLISNIASCYSNTRALIIGVFLPVGAIMVTLLISFTLYYFPSIYISETFLYLFFYITTGLVLVLCDGNIFRLYFSDSITGSYLPSMHSLMILFVIGPYKLIKNLYLYLLASFFLALIALVLNLYGEQRPGLSVFQFLILLLNVVFSCQRCQKSKTKLSRSIFVAYREEKNVDGPKSVLEEIVDHIQSVSEKIMDSYDLCDTEVRKKLLECVNELKGVFKTITTTSNIYETNIEVIGKDLDRDDKEFIEQNFIPRGSYMQVESEPIKVFKITKEPEHGFDQLSGILQQISLDWNLDTFKIRDLTSNSPIKFCGMYTIKKYNIIDSIGTQEKVLNSYLEKLESLYYPNPYHNNCHGADVMCSFLYLITSSSVITFMSTIELLGTIIGCLGHDVGHKGKNNRFHIMTRDPLSVLYNDISVLEMMHSSTVFDLLGNPAFDFLKSLNFDSFLWFRKIVVEMILATDMAKYFDQIGHFKAKYMNEALNLQDSNDTRLDLFKILIKCSDVGHAAKTIELHKKWCSLIMEEFFTQGDTEKSLGLSISMFCDRETTNIFKSQAGFIKNIVFPLFSSFNAVLFCEKIEDFCIKQLESNINYWESKLTDKVQTDGIESDRELLTVPKPTIKGRRGSMPLFLA